ncbi:hypothetical protein ACVWW4_006848 [Bradyrhizobium sp. LB7.1]
MLCHSSRGFGRDSRLAGIGILDHSDFVPHDTTGIEFVEDEPSTTLGIAVDRRRVPSSASRWTNVFSVEIVRDVSGRPSRGICRENAPDDRSFVVDDFEFAGFAGNGSISVGAPPGVSTVAYHAGHAATDLLRSVFALHLSNEAANTNQDRVRGAVMNSLDFDPLERQPFVDAGQVFHVTRKPIQRFHNDDGKSLLARRIHKLHQAIAAEYRCPRTSLVFESRNDVELMTGRIGPTQSDLIFSRLFVLKLGREPSVNCCGLHLEHHRRCVSRWRHQYESSSAAHSRRDDRAVHRRLQGLQQISAKHDLIQVGLHTVAYDENFPLSSRAS